MASFGKKLGKKAFKGAKRAVSAVAPAWFKGVIVTATVLLVLAVFVAAFQPTSRLVRPLVRSESEVREGFMDGCGGGTCSLLH